MCIRNTWIASLSDQWVSKEKPKWKVFLSKELDCGEGVCPQLALEHRKVHNTLFGTYTCSPRNQSFGFLSSLRTQVGQTRQFKFMELFLEQQAVRKDNNLVKLQARLISKGTTNQTDNIQLSLLLCFLTLHSSFLKEEMPIT